LRDPSRQYPQWVDQGFSPSNKEVSKVRVESCGPFENHKADLKTRFKKKP